MAEETIQIEKPETITSVPDAIVGVATKPTDIVSITEDNFTHLKPAWLKDEDIAYELKLFVLDVVESNDLAEIGFVMTSLHNLIQQIPELADNDPILYREYLRMLTVLKGSLLSNMMDTDVAAFLKENLLFALEVPDFELTDKLNDVFILARGFPVRIDDLKKMFSHALEENLEYLGTEGLKMKNEEEERTPTVRNWILDYNQFAARFLNPAAKQIKRGGVERAAYITQSENVANLNEDEKQILLRVLALYDLLRFGFTEMAAVKLRALPRTVTPKPSAVPQVPAAPRVAAPKPVIPKPPQVPKPPIIQSRPLPPVAKPVIPPPPPKYIFAEPKIIQTVKPPVIQPQAKPEAPAAPKVPAGITPEELKREVLTPELPKYIPAEPKIIQTVKSPVIQEQPKPAVPQVVPERITPVAVAPKPVAPPPPKATAVPRPNLPPKPVVPPAPAARPNFSEASSVSGLKSVDDVKYVDDLKRIRIVHLRQGNLSVQVSKIKSKISYLAAVNHLFPQEVVSIFELSPLFRLYLTVGNAMMNNASSDRRSAFEEAINKIRESGNEDMTLSEFETIADLRKEIERM
ncbi:MAG TPA: hypothetical protein VGQ87_02550 [Patescibacteria group bacterium]|jgi:hypothetical protein|nr:hypothetical protein [Patescibacteria group bacterium]